MARSMERAALDFGSCLGMVDVNTGFSPHVVHRSTQMPGQPAGHFVVPCQLGHGWKSGVPCGRNRQR